MKVWVDFHSKPSKIGVLKLFVLATPKIVSKNLATLKMSSLSCDPLNVKNIKLKSYD